MGFYCKTYFAFFNEHVMPKITCFLDKTLPEAQRTQGIESMIWMNFFSWNYFNSILVINMIQVIDSMPWVRCASGNVFFIFFSIFLSTFFPRFFHLFSTFSTCQVAFLELVLILATRWRYLNCLLKWQPDGTTCISCRFGQQLALLELVTSLVTKWCHLH